MKTAYDKFGKLRSYLWPVHRSELKKLLPMLLIVFLTTFIYNVLRSIKESAIVTAAGSGAEVIPFLKVWAMLPMAIFLTAIFIRLSHRYSSERVFHIMVFGFLAFFAIFTFVLYPIRDIIHPHELADRLDLILPKGLSGMVSMIRYWSFSLFYAMAETWGTICLTVLFWGFANEISSISEATRFYGILALAANLSSIPAGRVSYLLARRAYNPNSMGSDAWHQSLILITVAILVTGVVLMIAFRLFNKYVVSKIDLPEDHHNPQVDKIESKPSIRESFRYLAKSKYLTSIAIVVISYNLIINLVEVLWKGQLKMLYPNANDYTTYMSYITAITGSIAAVMALVISGNMIRKFGWTTTALLTPVIIIITSIGFFGFYLLPEGSIGAITAMLGVTPLGMIVFFGSAQNCFTRAAKYTVFDETKEICFIPLSRESRIKGKASIDGVASRVGKSGGSLMYQGMFLMIGRLTACAPYVAALLFFILGGWIVALRRLGRHFNELTAEKEQERETKAAAEQQIAEQQVV